MSGVLFGFEIATGVALFVVVLFVIVPRLWMPIRAWHYLHSKQTPPPAVRRYMVKVGIQKLKRSKSLPPEEQARLATQVMTAALDDKEGVFEGMHSDLLGEGMAMLGRIPLEHCASCRKPVFTHEAMKLCEEYYCDTCGKAKKLA